LRNSLLALALPALLLACPAEQTDSTVPPTPADPATPPTPNPVAQDKSSATGWTVYASLDLKVRDWRFGLLATKTPPPAPAEISAAMTLVGVDPLVTELKSLKSGEAVEVVVLRSEVWDHAGLLTDVHSKIVEVSGQQGLKLTIPEAVVPVHGVDSIRGDFEVICMEAKNAKSGDDAFVEATRKGIHNVRVTKAFREATEKPVGERVAHLYAVAKDEAKRRWRCEALEGLWPPSADAKKKIEELDKAPASSPAHPPMPARKVDPGAPASAPAP
jgi:hypothetical protein